MGHLHLSGELLDSVLKGDRSPSDLVPVVLAHLFDLCATCAHEYRRWQTEASAFLPESIEEAISSAACKLSGLQAKVRQEETAAAEKVEELLALPRHARLPAIQQSGSHFRGPALAKLLIEGCREKLPGQPKESWALAELANAVLEHSPTSQIGIELFTRAAAYTANAWRVLGKLPEASVAMSHARFVLRSIGGGDGLLRAELDNLEGLLRVDQRRFPEAYRLLRRAEVGFATSGVVEERQRTSLNLGIALYAGGDLEAAVDVFREVARDLERTGAPHLVLARHNLALALCDLGSYEESAALLEQIRSSPQELDPASALRVVWLEGKIDCGLENYESAESHLRAAVHGLASQGRPFAGAVASLDLAGVYLRQQRTAEVKEIARDLVEIFAEKEVHREAMAAAMLFEEAARIERVTIHLVDRLTTYYRQAERDPSLAFETPA